MKKIILFLTSYLFLITFYGCNSDDNEIDCMGLNKSMPEVTTTGENTFGCKINGKDWVAYTNQFDAVLGGEKKLSVRYRNYNNIGNARIQAQKIISELECNTFNQTFLLHISDAKEGVTEFTHNSEFYDWDLGINYKIDTIALNEINITRIDTAQSILSGTFRFQLISRDFQDTLKITEGRFDAPYSNL